MPVYTIALSGFARSGPLTRAEWLEFECAFDFRTVVDALAAGDFVVGNRLAHAPHPTERGARIILSRAETALTGQMVASVGVSTNRWIERDAEDAA